MTRKLGQLNLYEDSIGEGEIRICQTLYMLIKISIKSPTYQIGQDVKIKNLADEHSG